jgi:hypothetical protein
MIPSTSIVHVSETTPKKPTHTNLVQYVHMNYKNAHCSNI